MGCSPSKSASSSSYDQKRVEGILQKSPDNITDKDIECLKLFLKQHEKDNEMNKPLLLINDAQEKLTEISGHKEVELSVSEFDLAVAKLKGQMRKMKEKLKRLEGEKQHYIQLAVDAKKTDLTASKAYTKLAQSKISQIDRTYGIIMRLEDNLNTLDEAHISNEMVHMMDTVATTLESIQKEMGSKEDIEKIVDRINDLEDKVAALDDVFNVEEEDLDLEKINNEVDEELMEEAQKQSDLPEVPTHLVKTEKKEEEKEKKVEKRIAELE